MFKQSKSPFPDVGQKEGFILDFAAIGVSNKYKGQKIGSRIGELAFKNGVKKGYKYGFAFIVS